MGVRGRHLSSRSSAKKPFACLVADFIFDEAFGQALMIDFQMIWCALVIFTVTSVRQARSARRMAAQDPDSALLNPEISPAARPDAG
jgi:hypothetical protein